MIQLYPVSHFFLKAPHLWCYVQLWKVERMSTFLHLANLGRSTGLIYTQKSQMTYQCLCTGRPCGPCDTETWLVHESIHWIHMWFTWQEADNRQTDADTYSIYSLQSLLANEPIFSDNKTEIYHNTKLPTRKNCRHNKKPCLEGV